jgi:hypothetical protein
MAAVCAVALVAAALAACGTSKVKTSTKPVTSAPGATSGTSSDTASDDTSPPGTAGPTSVWSQTAVRYRGQNGKSFQITCTSHGARGSVWGTGPYTDDSSICTAAVQSGLITLAKGGTVTYQIAPGQDSYQAGVAHGVTSSAYAKWDGSFTFPSATGTIPLTAGPASWSLSMTAYEGQNGKQVTVPCSTKGTLDSVWGTGPFTDDSSVCSAAVFAGLITVADGGTVVATVAPGQNSYKGGTANGVTTQSYGSWGSSFTLSKSS